MKTRKWPRLASASTLALIVAATAACGNGNEPGASGSPSASPAQSPSEAAGEPVEISFLSLITTNLTEEFWDKWIGDFETKNPGIKVKRIQAPSLEGLNDNYAKTLLTSGDFPDVLSNISYQDFAKAGALMDIPIDDDIRKINDYESLLLDGKLYTLQAYLQPHTQIFYNKDLFAQAGIEQLPRTWDELEAAAEKLKTAGITPFLTAGDWMTTLTFSILTGPEIFGKNPNWYADKNAGKVGYQDENWMTVAGRYKDFASKGYFNKGALSIGYEQVEQEFLKGNGAMYPMGSWFTAAYAAADPGFEAGVFAPPTLDGEKTYMSGSRGTSFAVSNTTAHPEEALKFAKYLVLDPDFHKAFAASDGMFSGLAEPDNYEFSPLQQEIADLLAEAGTMSGYETQRAGDFPVNGLGNQLAKVGQNLLLEGSDLAKEMKSLDDYWEKNK